MSVNIRGEIKQEEMYLITNGFLDTLKERTTFPQ